MRADKRMSTIRCDRLVLADAVLEEPEPGRGIAAVVEAVQPGIEDQMPIGRIVISGRIGVRDVILGLRLGVREQPSSLLDSQDVLGATAGEDIVGCGIDLIRHKTGCDRAAGRWGASPVIGEDLIPVVRGRRRARRPQHCGNRVAIEFKRAQNAQQPAIFQQLHPWATVLHLWSPRISPAAQSLDVHRALLPIMTCLLRTVCGRDGTLPPGQTRRASSTIANDHQLSSAVKRSSTLPPLTARRKTFQNYTPKNAPPCSAYNL